MNIKRSTVVTLASIGLVAALGGTIVRAVHAGPQTSPNAKDVAGSTREVKDERRIKPNGNFIGGNGIIEPQGREVKLAAHVPGVVTAIHVKEGQRVSQGDVLVEFDTRQERAALAAAEADLALSRADLARNLHGLRSEDVEAVIAESEAAKARADSSKTTLEREEKLAKSGAVTVDSLDRAKHQSSDSDAMARAADARRRAALAGTRSEDIMVARARAASANARREEAKTKLDHAVVRAPANGEIMQVKFRVGEYYTPGGSNPLIVMGDTSKLTVRMDVDERDIGAVAVGAAAKVNADGYGERVFTGKVVEIGRRMGRKNVRSDDPTERIDTKILEVVIALDDPSSDSRPLVPGLRVMSYVESKK